MADFSELRKEVISHLDLKEDITEEQISLLIHEQVLKNSKEQYLSLKERVRLSQEIYHSICGLDILQDLLDDESITEIMINGPGDIFIEQKGTIRRAEQSFADEDRLDHVIQQIVAQVNRRVNETTPIVDARLSDGSRVNIVLKPIALNGPVVTIRKFRSKPMTMEQLTRLGALDEETADEICRWVQSGYNIFVSGGTGSGKTTFLNAISEYIPRHERVITIEDSAELRMDWIPNLVKLETRTANVEGKNAITIRDLLKSSLRMRPDRIVVGEVRGPEALDMLQAMNTGHDGSLSTGHANSPLDMLSRLETMVLMGIEMPLAAIRQQIVSGVDLIIHLGRLRDRSRRVLEITEVLGLQQDKYQLNPLYRFQEIGGTMDRVTGKLVQTGQLQATEKLLRAGL